MKNVHAYAAIFLASPAVFSIIGALVFGSEPTVMTVATVKTAEFKQHHFNVESEEVVCGYFNRMEIIGNNENGIHHEYLLP